MHLTMIFCYFDVAETQLVTISVSNVFNKVHKSPFGK